MELPWKKTDSEPLTFRDHLAASRTIFASERTLLAYMRTSLTMTIVGITLIKLFNELLIQIIGWMCIPTAIGLFIIGFVRHKQRKVVILMEEQHRNGSGDKKVTKRFTVKAHPEF